MKNSFPYLIAGLLVVGAAVALLVDNSAKKIDRDARVGEVVMAPDQLTAVDKITIKKADKELVLERQNNRWQTGDEAALPVDAKEVVTFLENVSTADITRLVGEGSEQISSLGFATGTSVTLAAAGKPVVDVVIGKNRTKGGQYIQFAGTEKGYQITKALSASPDGEAWELKTLVNVEGDEVKAVTLKPVKDLDKTAVTLSSEKKEDPLKVVGLKETEKEKGGPAALNRILSGVNFSKRVDKGNAEAAAALENPSVGEVELFSGLKYKVEVGKIGDETPKYYMRVTADPAGASLDAATTKEVENLNRLMGTWSYEVASFVGQKFEKGRSDYVEDKPAEDKSSKSDGEDSDKKKS